MPKNVRFLLLSAGAAVFIGYSLFVNVRLKKEESLNSRLTAEKEKLQAHSIEIQGKIAQLAWSLSEKEAQIRELSDGAALRQALSNAQVTIEELSKSLDKVNNEKQRLRDENLNLTSRLQNTSKEFNRAGEELKLARKELASVEREQIAPLKRKIEELSHKDSSVSQIAQLKKELSAMEESSTALNATNKAFEMKIRELEKQRSSIQTSLSGVKKEIERQDEPLGSFQNEIQKLSDSLAQKRDEIRMLESELLQLHSLKLSANKQIAAQLETIKGLESSNKNLREQIAGLSDTLGKQRPIQESPQSSALYEHTKEQIKGLTEILVKKEMELDKARRDSLGSVEKMVGLQTRISELEKALSASEVDQDKIRDIDSQRMKLQADLSAAQEALNKKNEVIDSLQKNLDYLNQQIAAKDTEKKSALERLSQLEQSKSSSADQLARQKAHVEEVDLLYNSLKSQVAQLTDLLNQKESELEQRRKEMVSLKEEMVALKTRSMDLEQDLADARDRQKKTVDDLTAAVRLNAVLQERMGGTGSSLRYSDSVSRDKQNAEEMRRKVEVILAPQK